MAAAARKRRENVTDDAPGHEEMISESTEETPYFGMAPLDLCTLQMRSGSFLLSVEQGRLVGRPLVVVPLVSLTTQWHSRMEQVRITNAWHRTSSLHKVVMWYAGRHLSETKRLRIMGIRTSRLDSVIVTGTGTRLADLHGPHGTHGNETAAGKPAAVSLRTRPPPPGKRNLLK